MRGVMVRGAIVRGEAVRGVVLGVAVVAAVAVLSGCGARAPSPAGDKAPSPTSTTNPPPKTEPHTPGSLASTVIRAQAPGGASLSQRGEQTHASPAHAKSTQDEFAHYEPANPKNPSSSSNPNSPDRPLHRQDHFRAGSITKTFTAVVLLQLAAEEKLTLDDTVEYHLPGLIRGHGNDGRKITLRQLLTHTSGLFSYTDTPKKSPKPPDTPGTPNTPIKTPMPTPTTTPNRTFTPKSLIQYALGHPPLFAPGTNWAYSNTNYAVLGLVIEKVTSRSYADEARRRIITPLKLTGTSFPGTDRHLPTPHSRGYSGTPASATDVTELNPSSAGAAGEVISTLDDLNRLYSALLSGQLLPAAQLAQMRDTTDSQGRYGMGLMPTELSCTTVWGHNGTIAGSYAETATTTDGRHTFTYRLNADWFNAEKLKTPLLEKEFCAS